MPMFSIICATLLRPSYASLVASVRRQTFRDYEFIGRGDVGVGINEYVCRNRAAKTASGDYLVYVDDDSLLRPDHLAKLAKVVEKDRPAAIGGPLMLGSTLLDQPLWGVGANLTIRRDVFEEMGGFETDWGLPSVPRGWRADTQMWWSIEDRHGTTWLHDLVVDHPGPMGSVWQPAVEDVFVRRWKSRAIERFIHVDYRLQKFLLETQDLTPDERAKVISARREMRRTMPQLPVLPQEG